MDFNKIKEVLIKALVDKCVDEYEIYYASGSDCSVGALNREVNNFSSGSNAGICLRLLADGKMGYASTELFEETELISLVDRAIENALATEKEDLVGIYCGSDEYEDKTTPVFNPIDVSELKNDAKQLCDRLFDEDKRVTDGTSTQCISTSSTVRIVNSHGLDLENTSGVNVLFAEAVLSKDGESQAAYVTREYKGDKDETMIEMAKKAVGDALDKMNASLVSTGKYNVIIDGKPMRSILSVFSPAFSAKRVLDGMSPLKDKIGERIASTCITITDDPQREGNPVGTTFDAEGVATHRKAVVKEGILMTYLHNRETALRMNTETTANASKTGYSGTIGISPHSFAIECGEDSLDELFEKAENGIYITEVKGLHAGANPVTGDFSLESAGFVIRNGRKCEAVKSFTVAGNFLSLLSDVSAVSNELERGVPSGITGFASPAVLVREMSVAGK